MARPKRIPNQSAGLIKPLVSVAGQKHLLETLEEMPVMKSVGYMKFGDKRNSWISYTLTTKGKEVLSIEVGEPDLRQIAESSAKIAFVQTFIDADSVL